MMPNPTNKQAIEEAKRHYDLASVFEQSTGQQVGRNNLYCPFHQDSTPSFHVYADGGWKCFGCGRSGDVLDFIGLMLYGLNYDPHTQLKDVIDSLGSLDIKPVPRQSVPDIRPALDPQLARTLHRSLTEREFQYWGMTGIHEGILARFTVGWTGQRYAFPWTYRGVLTAIKLRRDDDLFPRLEPKYISAKGSRYTAPYGIDFVILPPTPPDVLLIVEDEKSVLAASVYGLVAIAAPANAWKADWCNLLSGVGRIVIIPDNDQVGTESAYRIQGMIRRAEILAPPVGKDLFDLHSEWMHLADAQERIGNWLGL